MSNYFSLLYRGGFLVIAIVLIIMLGLFALIWWNHRRSKQVALSRGAAINVSLNPEVPDDELPKELPKRTKGKSVLGTGKYRCVAYRRHPKYGPSADYTTMPEPIGEIDLAETSCPMSGAVYVVVEQPDGAIVPYNEPRQKIIKDSETPEAAWDYTHWEDCRRYWTVPRRWFQSVSNWMTIGMMAITFIVLLVTLGGGK